MPGILLGALSLSSQLITGTIYRTHFILYQLYPTEFSQQSYEVGIIVIIIIFFQMRKLKLKEVKWLSKC